MLSKQDILNHVDSHHKTIKAFGGEVKVRSLDFPQFVRLCEIVSQPASNQKTVDLTLLCCGCIVDENDEPLFDASDAKALMRKSEKSLTKIVSTVMEMSNWTPEQHEELKKN